MPLKIQLRPEERIIINGAVIEAAPDGRTEIAIMNKAAIMRQKHIMPEKEANTPAKRLYFCLQMLYIDPENEKEYRKHFDKFHKDLDETVTLAPLKKSLEIIRNCVEDKKYYDAMKACRELINVETELLGMSGNSGSSEETSDKTDKKKAKSTKKPKKS